MMPAAALLVQMCATGWMAAEAFDETVWNRLVRSNSWRTWAWTLRLGLILRRLWISRPG